MFLRRKLVDEGEYSIRGSAALVTIEFVPRVLRKGYRAATIRRPLSTFTMTGANHSMTASADSDRDWGRIKPMIPWWVAPLRASIEDGPPQLESAERCLHARGTRGIRDLRVRRSAATPALLEYPRFCALAHRLSFGREGHSIGYGRGFDPHDDRRSAGRVECEPAAGERGDAGVQRSAVSGACTRISPHSVDARPGSAGRRRWFD